jgi:hypothetical protein
MPRTLAVMYLRRPRFADRSSAAALAYLSTAVTQPAPAAKKNSAWASGGPAEGSRFAEGEQLGRCAAEQSKYYRLYLHSGEITLAAITFDESESLAVAPRRR